MKLRTIKLTLEQFSAMLQGKASPFANSLPADLEVLDAKVDLFAMQVLLVVRSGSFEDLVDSMPIPELTQTNSQDAAPAPKPAIPVKAEAKPEFKPVITKPAAPPASRYAAKMENEFSPEQRKLLNFTVRGNFVVVKPVTFLKTEWEDINEVVRDLGGRWVKGDIISYWEIPLQ